MNLNPTSKLSTTWALKWRAIRVTRLVVTSVRITIGCGAATNSVISSRSEVTVTDAVAAT